jgi:hypothetical protein
MERKTDGQAERASTSWAGQAGQAGQQGVWPMSIITIYLLWALVLLRVLLPKCRRRRQPCSHIKAAFHLAFSALAHTLARLK